MAAPDQGQGSSDYPVRSVPPSQLLGSDPSTPQSDTPGGGQSGQASGPDEGLRMAAQIVRQMQTGVQSLAKQFPSAARPLREADSALRAAMKAIISSPSGTEPTPPEM